MAHKLHNVVYARLEAIANAEKITKAELREMSRELLEYVPDTNDIDIVNRLINVLTPMNRRLSILYFGHFLPWVKETDDEDNFLRFGKKMPGEKQVSKRMKAIEEWLADETCNIWTWGDDNVEMKQKDFTGMIANAVKRALNGDEKSNTPAITFAEAVESLFKGGVEAGVKMEDMLESMLTNCQSRQEAQEQAEQEYLESQDAA